MLQLGSLPFFRGKGNTRVDDRGKGKTPVEDREFEVILLIIELFFDISLIFQCFDF